MIDFVVFDIFGVLLSRGFPSSSAQLCALLSTDREKIRIVYEKWEKPFDLGQLSEHEFWINIQRELGTTADWRQLNRVVLESYFPLPGAFDLIKRCSSKTQVFALSNTRREWFEYLDRKFSIRSLFNKMFLSFEIGLLKPEPACFAYLIKELNRSPEHIAYLDDDPENVRVASSLGLVSTRYVDVLAGEQFLEQLGILTDTNQRAWPRGKVKFRLT